MSPTGRVRAALLRLSPPWRRRHPVVLATVTQADRVRLELHTRIEASGAVAEFRRRIDANAAAERDPSDEAGA